jgi:4-coumarate--CoA ligase
VRLLHDPIYYGISAIVMERFEIEAFCAAVQQHRATFAHVVPPVLLLLVKHPVVGKYDLSSLQMMSSGAAPLSWFVMVDCSADFAF